MTPNAPPKHRIKTMAVEIQWDGPPPVPQRLRQIGRLFARIEPDLMTDPDTHVSVTAESLTTQGVRFEWHKPRMSPADLARLLGAVHPVRIRYAGITWRKTREEDVPAGYDAWEAIKSAPWIRSRDIGGAL